MSVDAEASLLANNIMVVDTKKKGLILNHVVAAGLPNACVWVG